MTGFKSRFLFYGGSKMIRIGDGICETKGCGRSVDTGSFCLTCGRAWASGRLEMAKEARKLARETNVNRSVRDRKFRELVAKAEVTNAGWEMD
jgi:hypothetical protein